MVVEQRGDELPVPVLQGDKRRQQKAGQFFPLPFRLPCKDAVLGAGRRFRAHIVRQNAVLCHLFHGEDLASGQILAEIPLPPVHLGIRREYVLCDRHIPTIHGDDVGDDSSILVPDFSVVAIFLPFFHSRDLQSQIF